MERIGNTNLLSDSDGKNDLVRILEEATVELHQAR